MNLCVIPARGGSKRIPRKNIKNFCGKPIIEYPISVALRSRLFDEVMVSTDDREIAQVALECGATIPFLRSREKSDDWTPLADVINEVKQRYLERGMVYRHICCILPTAPLITIEMLRFGYELLVGHNADSVRPLVRFGSAIERAIRLQEDGNIVFVHEEHRNTRSQDLEPAFYDSGQFYWMQWDSCLYGGKRYGFEITEIEAQDIDNDIDWKHAEMKYQYLNQTKDSST